MNSNSVYLLSGLAVSGYGIYKIGQKPDAVKRESLYIAGAFLVGAGFFIKDNFMTQPTTRVGEIRTDIGAGLFVGAAAYTVSRLFLKKNVKKSLLISGVIAAGVAMYNEHKHYSKKQQQTTI